MIAFAAAFTAALIAGAESTGASTGASPTPSQLEAFNPFPASARDLEDRLIVRFEIGFDPIFTALSGAPDIQANEVTEASLRTKSLFLFGNAAFGTRSIGLETFHTYVLAAGAADLEGNDVRPASESVLHRFEDARQLLFHLVYGELEGLTTSGALSRVFIRAGRQFHFGIAPATFDGGTVGYDGDTFHLALRGGRRSAIFDRTQNDPGLLFGGTIGWTFGAQSGTPLAIRAEVVHFMRDLQLVARDSELENGARELSVKATLAELSADYQISRALDAWARFSFVSPEPSHARAGLEWRAGGAIFAIDLDQKLGRDLFFDLAAGGGATCNDVRVTYETFRLNIPDPRPYSDVQLTALVPIAAWLELDASPGARIYFAGAEERSPFDADRLSIGAGVHGRFVLDAANGLEADAAYLGTIYLRGDDAAGFFRDDDMGGESLIHEISAGVRYTRGGRFIRRRMLGGQTLSTGISAFLRAARVKNRLIDALDDATYGGIADVRWSFTDYTRIQLSYEYARDSQLFVPELADFHRVRASVEARF